MSPESAADLQVTFTVAAVARRLGVAGATLRTWDRRYGLGPTGHEAGAHRRYTAEDVARLESMRRMVNAGVPAANAARIARATDPADLPQSAPEAANAGGGDVIPMGAANSFARGLARAALSLDSIACREVLMHQLNARGAMWTWQHVISPVLIGVGNRWESTQRGIEVEHLLSETIISAFSVHTASLTNPKNVRPILLACAADDLHTLPLHAIAAGLRDFDYGVRMLGARLPHDSLVAAINRIGPSAVVIWAQMQNQSDPTRLAGLPHVRAGVRIFAGGPGWPEELPEGVSRLASVPDAVSTITSLPIL